LLARHKATASFFTLTDRLPEGESILHEMLAGGHEVGIHGDRHDILTGLRVEPCLQRLRAMRHRLEDKLGIAVRLYRPPLGRTSVSLLRAARRAGLVVVLWSHDPRDWAADAEHSMQVRLRMCLVPGAVVLLHDRCHAASSSGVRSQLSAALGQAGARGIRLRNLSAALECAREHANRARSSAGTTAAT
jgi:peptidoglycan/xylan/chitin deacetylase (PgdA/CDA1 family)